LLFWSLDRLSREGTVATLNHLQRLTGYGVNYRSFTEQYLDSTGMFNEAVIGILAAVAKQERVRLSERTIAGLQRDRAHGRVSGRPRIEHNLEIVTKAIVNPDGTSQKVTEAKELNRVWLESGVQKQVPEWVLENDHFRMLENDHFRMLEAEDSASAVA